MDKLTLQSKNRTQEHVEKIAQLFPNVVTEAVDERGQLKRAIDFELLKQELSDTVVGGEKERYQLTWPGKKKAILLANTPTDKTLRPVKADSVDWERTQNVYIEGDNLEALKLLQEAYLNKVKCIYIDPPYNTGKDFIYKDDFKTSSDEYLEQSGQVDEAGNRLFQNSEVSGRFHSDWLSMMYARLKLARLLLREDGVIFISIDDNEAANLKKMCDEIFGENHYVETFYIQVRYANKSLTEKDDFQKLIEQVLVYSKGQFKPNKPYEPYALDKFKYKVVEKGEGTKTQIGGKNVTIFKKGEYDIVETEPGLDGLKETWASGTVLTGNASGKFFDQYLSPRADIDGLGTLYKVEGIGEDGLGYRYFTGPKRPGATKGKFYSGVPLERRQEIEAGRAKKYKPIINFYDYSASFGNIRHEGGIDFRGGKKPVKMLKELIKMSTGRDDIVLDFFAGSSSTAHAVMEVNAEDQGNRKFIMVQLPEPVDENSDYYRAGFTTISEMGKERIRRAARKIREETGAEIDYGFRVFKVDTSNMKDVSDSPGAFSQEQLSLFASNIKEDRTSEDLLVQAILACGLELSLPIETRDVDGRKVHFVAENALVACFDEPVTDAVVRAVATVKPSRAVFRDSSFADDADRLNAEEMLKRFSPGTEVNVI